MPFISIFDFNTFFQTHTYSLNIHPWKISVELLLFRYFRLCPKNTWKERRSDQKEKKTHIWTRKGTFFSLHVCIAWLKRKIMSETPCSCIHFVGIWIARVIFVRRARKTYIFFHEVLLIVQSFNADTEEPKMCSIFLFHGMVKMYRIGSRIFSQLFTVDSNLFRVMLTQL